LNAFVGSDLDAVQIYRSLPQEDTRLTVPREHLETHIEHIKSIATRKFAELVFNLDEAGSSDWTKKGRMYGLDMGLSCEGHAADAVIIIQI
jgi:hypothetical protein